MMWSKDYITFSYDGSRVLGSYGYQECGSVFPNKVTTNGITRVQTTSNMHKWRGKKTIGAGIPSPWGDIYLYSTDFTDYYKVYADASYCRC